MLDRTCCQTAALFELVVLAGYPIFRSYDLSDGVTLLPQGVGGRDLAGLPGGQGDGDG